LESILDLAGFSNEFAKEFSVSPMNIQDINLSESGFSGLFSGNRELVVFFMRVYIKFLEYYYTSNNKNYQTRFHFPCSFHCDVQHKKH